MFDERVVVRFHYDDAGRYQQAEMLSSSQTPRHIAYRDAALTSAVPLPVYWARHPQYRRENWLVT